MALGPKIAGTVFVSVDGITYQMEGDCSYSAVAIKRETLTGQDHVHGFKELPTPGKIKLGVRDSGGLVVADFNNMTNVTVVMQLANGKNVVGSAMWQVDDLEVETSDAKFTVMLEGLDGSVIELPTA